MFIRTKTTPNSPRKSIQVVDGRRDASGKVKQRIVRHVGIAHNEDEEMKLKAIGEEFILAEKARAERESRQMSLFPNDSLTIQKGRPKKKRIEDIIPVSEVRLNQVEEVARIVEGVHEVGGCVYDSIGFDSLMERKRDKAILKDIVLSRMVSPDSKMGLQKQLSGQFAKEHDLDSIYRMMDKLHGGIATIKELCFNSTKSLIPNKEVTMLFFDVTTLYFESTDTDELRAFGYSKDHRFNTTQLVLALATNEDGLPLGYELFSGNTAEVTTLLKAIRGWSDYLNIKDVCFVADRAMFSRENLAALDESGYRYIVAAKLKTLKGDVKEKILAEESYKPTVLGKHLAWVSDIEYEGKRLITSYKSSRAMNDAKNRREVLDKIEKTIGQRGSTKKLISNSGVKKYTTTANSITQIDQDKIAADAMWDGLHGVITNDKNMDAAAVIARYAGLWVIEDSFRINKHNLQMRPIFHYTPKRIEAHIAICYMGFAIIKYLQYKVALTQKISPREIMRSLLGVQASILQHKITGDLYRMPGVFKQEARKIYKTFGVARSSGAEVYYN